MKGDEWTNKDGTPTQAYLIIDSELCGKHTHEVDYDHLGNGTHHLGCEQNMRKTKKLIK